MPETQYKKLLSCQKKENYEVAINLAKKGDPALQYITKSLSENDGWVRMFMADALENIGDGNAIRNTIPLLKKS